MAEKTLNTRISLKYGAIGNWTDSFKPLKGEVCFAEVTTQRLDDASGKIVDVPAAVFKVGDGTKTFGELPWVSALAADVHDWAKLSQPDFEDYLDDFIGDRDTNDNTTYSFETGKTEDNKGKLVITETPHKQSGKISYTDSVEGLTKPKGEATGEKIPGGEANVTTTNSFTGFRNIFYYYGTVISETLTSDVIRGWEKQPSTNKTVDFINDTTYSNTTGAIYVAIPSESAIASAFQIPIGEGPLNITSQFSQMNDTVDVEGANGYTPKQYKVFAYNPSILPGNYEFTINIS
jgi:hypothetical protein